MSRWSATHVSVLLRAVKNAGHTQANEFPCSANACEPQSMREDRTRVGCVTTSFMPIQKAKRLLELFHLAPTGFDARISWNCPTWLTMDLWAARGDKVQFLNGRAREITYSTVGRYGATSAESMVAPPEARLNT